MAHAPVGVLIAPHPECTFDDGEYSLLSTLLASYRVDPVAENAVAMVEGPKTRYEKLENRISPLRLSTSSS